MNKIKNHFNRLFRLILLFVLSITTLFAPFGVAHAQFPGTNGRILWAAPSNYYTIKPAGTDINNTTIPITNQSGAKWGAEYNPAGTSIFYTDTCTSDPDFIGLFSILNTHASPGSEVKCTNAGAVTKQITEPAVSPDGLNVAFTEHRDDTAIRQIHVTSSTGTGNTTLTNLGASITNPVWDPDGSLIYAKFGGDIVTILPATANQAVVQNTIVTGGVCRLSDIDPTGTTMLYISATAGCNAAGQLTTHAADGSGSSTVITTDATFDYVGATFSPDGTQIVAVRIASNGTGTAELVTMNADGSNIVVMPNVTGSGNPGVLNLPTSTLGSRSLRPYWSTDQTTFNTSAPTCTLSASPSTLTAAGNSTISWTSTNATTLTLDQNLGSVTPVAAGSASAVINSTVTITGTATGPGGSGTCSATVTVAAASGGGGTLANAGRNLLTGAFVGLIILGSVFALNSTEIKKLAKAIARKK